MGKKSPTKKIWKESKEKVLIEGILLESGLLGILKRMENLGIRVGKKRF